MKKLLSLAIVSSILICTPITAQAKGNDTYLSEEIQDICVEAGNEYGICPELLMAIIERESSGQADAENGGCKGLMQISDRWHVDRMEKIGVTDIYDIRGNIFVGADYLAELRDEYGDVALVLSIYHGESDAEEKYERGKMSSYAEKILERSAELEELHENERHFSGIGNLAKFQLVSARI